MKPMTARSAILTAVLLFLLPSCSGSREDAGFPGPSGSPMPLSGTQPAVVLPEVIEEEPVRIVMIGDSLTARRDFASYFPEADLCNLGHDGDTVYDVTERLGEIGEADRIFLLCGINSLADGLEEAVAAHYRILLDTMAALYPEAEVYVQSVLPVSAMKGPAFSRTDLRVIAVEAAEDVACGASKMILVIGLSREPYLVKKTKFTPGYSYMVS